MTFVMAVSSMLNKLPISAVRDMNNSHSRKEIESLSPHGSNIQLRKTNITSLDHRIPVFGLFLLSHSCGLSSSTPLSLTASGLCFLKHHKLVYHFFTVLHIQIEFISICGVSSLAVKVMFFFCKTVFS